MGHLRHIGKLFSQDTLGYWRALYVLLLVVWSVSTIWRVASGSLLETPETSSTLIKIGLLEAVAFLAAWSLLLITLTTKIVNKGRDLEYETGESNRKLDDMKADMRRHEKGHPDIESEVERVAERVMQVEKEAKRVAEENEQLRRQLAATATKDWGG